MASIELEPGVETVSIAPLSPFAQPMGSEITVKLNRTTSRKPIFIIVVHPGPGAAPIVNVDKEHRPAPTGAPVN